MNESKNALFGDLRRASSSCRLAHFFAIPSGIVYGLVLDVGCERENYLVQELGTFWLGRKVSYGPRITESFADLLLASAPDAFPLP